MALPHQSIATINAPEFINLQPLDINPFMSSCEIKVLYLGENRNGSYISKEVAAEMSKTLRGAPIVGYYKKDKEDFADHGQQMILDDEGIHFNVLTKPYGFVAPDAKVWFQKFEDTDDFGNSVEREYLMTTGYLWTGQFEEAQIIVDQGKPQSMELDEETLDGHWATNVKKDMEFFIINDAIFTKLCILGDDTEPCFEGASITKPDVSSNFSYGIDQEFKKTLFSMINDLRDALKGGNEMSKEESKVTEATFEKEQKVSTETSEVNASFDASEVNTEVPVEEEGSVEETFEKEETEEKPADSFKEEDQEEKEKEEEPNSDEEEEQNDKKQKYSLLEQKYTELETKYNELMNNYTQLKSQNEELSNFKLEVENNQKDALIYSDFYMISEEDKKDIIENKEKYTLDEIKAKLAVIGYEKKINFNSDSENNEGTEEDPIVTFSFNNDDSNLPDWVKAVKTLEENN